MDKGPIMSFQMAAEHGEVNVSTIRNYVKSGLVKPIEIAGVEFVYYRDVLRASWESRQANIKAGKTLGTGNKGVNTKTGKPAKNRKEK